jgi:hypothetical protein
MDALRQRAQQWLQDRDDMPGAVGIGINEAGARIIGALLAALEAQQGEWQDIETAPKDGTWVLLWSSHWRDGGKTVRVPVIAAWSSFSSGWVNHDGDIYKPTHWAPLLHWPEPPQ